MRFGIKQKARGERFRRRVVEFLRALGYREEAFLIVLACLIGALTGVGSVGFTKLIELVHGLCYGHDQRGGLFGGHSLLLVLLPMGGALLVGIITYFFAREARGHGVPEVMDAIAQRDGKIRPRVALAKAVSSALTIGSGGSAGTEGPIIQIGAALGSTMGQYFHVFKHNMPVLVGCGAAAGISAIFHAPIAGVLFALEIFLRELNFKTLSPLLMASVLSSVVVSKMLGRSEAIFPLIRPETIYTFHWYELGNYIVLGLLCAVAAVLFVRLLYWFEDFFGDLKVHYIAKPVIGGAALGGLGLLGMVLFPQTRGMMPLIFGNGYGVIARCIGAGVVEHVGGLTPTIGVLVLLLLMKLLATCFTLGSGGSGGVFAPSLFLGAVVGYAFGLALQHIGVFAFVSPETYALVGMAGVVAASTHAPMTGMVIVFEMTKNYDIMLPVMFTATVALTISRQLFADSIYTLKLHRRGVHYETRAKTSLLRRLNVEMVMKPGCEVVYDDAPLQAVLDRAVGMESAYFVVVDHGARYWGMITAADLRASLLQPQAIPLLVAGEVARQDVPTVTPADSLDVVMEKFSRLEVNCLPVHHETDNNCFVGMISRAALMRRYQQELADEKG